MVGALAGAAHAEPLVVWHSSRGDEQQALQQAIAAWNAEGNTEAQELQIPHEALSTKINNAIPRGAGPDLFIFAHERTGDWSQAGLLQAIPEPPGGSFSHHTLDAFRVEGALHALPLSTKSLALFRNTDRVPEAPATTDEMLAQARESKAEGRTPIAVQADSFYFHAPWWFGFGGPGLDDQGLMDFNHPGGVASLGFLGMLSTTGLIPKEPTWALTSEMFRNGEADYAISGPWFLAELDDTMPFAVSPLPVVSETGLPARPFLTVEGVFVPTGARPEALALAQALAGPALGTIRQNVGHQVVAHLDTPGTDDPHLAAFAEQARLAQVMSNRPEMRDVWEPGEVAVKAVLRGIPADQAAEAGARRYSIITRPPPPQGNTTLGLAASVVLALAGLGWLILGARRGFSLAPGGSARRAWPWVTPSVLATGLLIFVPFAVGLGLSLFSHRSGTYTYVGLANFVDILGAGTFRPTEPLSFYYALFVTVLWTITNVLAHLALGIALALVLNRPTIGLRPLFRVLLVLPWAVPNYITALIWKGMFHGQHGVINAGLEAIGIAGIAWFNSFPTAFFANLITNIWLGFPFMMVVALGALQSIPKAVYEAASIDGASAWQQFRHITLPMLLPAMVPAVLLGTVWTFNQFNIVYLVSAGEPANSTDILISEAWRWAFSRREQYGYAAAYAALIFAVLLGWAALSARIGKAVEGQRR